MQAMHGQGSGAVHHHHGYKTQDAATDPLDSQNASKPMTMFA